MSCPFFSFRSVSSSLFRIVLGNVVFYVQTVKFPKIKFLLVFKDHF
jgi:hypothetical protein